MNLFTKRGCLISCISVVVVVVTLCLIFPIRFIEHPGTYQTFIFSERQTDQSKIDTPAKLQITRFKINREIVIDEMYGEKALEVAASIGRCYDENRETKRPSKPVSNPLAINGVSAARVFVCLEYNGKWGVCRVNYDPDYDPASVMLFLESISNSYRVVPRDALPEIVRIILDKESGTARQ